MRLSERWATSLLLLFAPKCLVIGAPQVDKDNSDLTDYYFDDNYEYSYGDPNFGIEDVMGKAASHPERLRGENHTKLQVRETEPFEYAGPVLPLCCSDGLVYDMQKVNCSSPPENFGWRPFLNGAPSAQFEYMNFPRCKNHKMPIEIYQKDVFFQGQDVVLPRYIQMIPAKKDEYCVVKIYDDSDPTLCEEFQTKVFVCLTQDPPVAPGVYWSGVVLAHTLIFLTVLSYVCIKELRCLQGQYMICFFISLLIYNICLVPGSGVQLSIDFVSCVSLGAVKYFFFCGTFLWYNVVCFDVWRTMKKRIDIGSRKRFLAYSVYSWVVSAIMTTAVLVMPYIDGRSMDSSLMVPTKEYCELKTDINMLLQIIQTLIMMLNFVFLCLATSNCCSYTKFGNGLPRIEAVSWMWHYVILESIAIFSVFAYRKTVLRAIHRCIFHTRCYRPSEEVPMHEKDQLAVVY